jgi:hypothetical protein
MTDFDAELERMFDAAKQRNNPRADDHARISERLRAQLGAAVVDGNANTPGLSLARGHAGRSLHAASGRGGWIAALVGTGVVMGAVGFVVGYGMGQRDQASAAPTAPVVAHADREAKPASSSSSNESESLAPATPPSPPQAVAPAPADAGNDLGGPRQRRAKPTAAAARSGSSAGSEWPFARALESLRRANFALAEGRPLLALIELDQLERHAGNTLREEREVTSVLAECALGRVDRARRRAARLLDSSASSLYALRLEESCAGGEEK